MMLTMHGLPNKIKYNEIKILIKEKCNLTDFILGNLGVDEDRTKNVRIGVPSEVEGDIIIKCLDGCRYSGQVLRIVPIGKVPSNETPKVKVSNDNTYQWNNQQPDMNYVNPMNPAQQGGWPVQANQQWSNTQPIPQQILVQNNYEYVQPVVAQQNFYQERFPQNRGPQEIFSHNVPSNLIEPPRGNQPRPHAPVNITDQQQNRQPTQGGRYPNQGFNPEKPQTMSKQGFQGPSHMGSRPTQPGQEEFHGQQWSSHGSQETSRFQKQNPPQFEKTSNKIMHPDKRQIVSHNQGRNVEPHYEKGGRRFSPPRNEKDSNHGRRVSPPGHRISPSGHRILPSGRRISPPPRNSQFKNRDSPPGRRISPTERRISPTGRRISPTGRRISPQGRKISPPGRRISPPGRRFSPQRQIHSSGRQMSPTGRQNLQHGGQNQPGRRFSPPSRPVSPSGRHFAQSDRQNFHPGSKISLSGRRNSPPARQMAPTGRPVSPSGRRMSPSGRRFSPSGRRNSPPGRRISPGRQFSPSSRRISPHGQRISPSGRRMSPMGRKHSPSGRRITPERSFLPPGRRVSPGPGVIPSGRRISPSGRRMSPGNRTLPERRVSPGHRIAPMNKDDRHMQQRMSPGKPGMMRNMSPGRHSSPNRRPPSRSFDRYSPSRKPMDKIRPGPKEVRPAYASMTQAQSQPMYSGGYAPESRETEQYPPGHRKGDQRPNWQEREKPYQSPVQPVEDRRDLPGVPKYESRRGGDYPRPVLSQLESKATSPGRMSRSPNRRDRSPVRDRNRRHSPSPRSPRRSWALEKRRSPNDIEPPPPPSWPERQENVYKSNRQHDEEDKKPVWIKIEARQKQEVKTTFFHKEDRHSYDRDDKKYFSNPSRSQWDSHHQPQLSDEFRDRSPLRPRSSDKYSPNQNESKSSREDFPMNRRNEFQQQSPRYQEPRVEQFQNREKIKEDFNEFRHKRDDYHQSFNSREENLYLGQENLDREIEDVYSRAAELTRKTDEYQRKRNSNIRFTVRQHSPEEVDFKNVKEEPFKQDFYEASHSKFDKTPRQMGEVVSGDLAPAIQYKRDKAVDDLSRKVLMKFAQKFKGKLRHDVEEQLKILIEDMIFEMFGDKDVSFIEIVIKFEEKHGIKGMEKIFDKVISKFPIEIRLLKQQPAPDLSTSPVTISRSGSSLSMRDNELPAESNISDWNIDGVVSKEEFDEPPVMAPVVPMVPMMFPMVMAPVEPTPNIQEDWAQEGYCLYLCKDNFKAFNDKQGQYLKDFIVKSIIEASETSNDSWTPDLTLRGVQKDTRYVVWTSDELSRNWLLKLDFSKFSYFNVIIYTSEDYVDERAAIWLPGHTKTRGMPPLKKLVMQNRHLSNVNIQTWKLVREIVIEKGTRLYVDMPPSSARALEKHKMTLSYELQKVQVFLRAVAIDTDAFDAGLEEISSAVSTNLYQKNAPMPAIDSEAPHVIKLCLDNTPVSVSTARKIKEELISQMYKYIKDGGKSRMDFLKYGYCKPGYFCVIPENTETAKWVKTQRMRRFNNHMITVCEAEKVSVKYITMTCLLPYDQTLTPKKVVENFKMSNRGVKGLKFNLWKNGRVFTTKNNTKTLYRADVDLESVDTLMKLNFSLDYSKDNRKSETVIMKYHYKVPNLKDMIQRFKEETTDTLRVTNMEISSEDEDIICLE